MSAGTTTQGRRLPDATWDVPGAAWEAWKGRQHGDYMKVIDPPAVIANPSAGGATWYVCDPHGRVGTLRTHTIVEHEDGTITVTPSILDDRPHDLNVTDGIPSIAGPGWHGFLERGVWREV